MDPTNSMLINDLEINTYPSVPNRINYHKQHCNIDSTNLYTFDASTQNFDYKFNSWGFRDEDFEKYIGKKVNICLGDSIAVNIGGPVEHSWPSQLKTYFDIPTLNFGMEMAGNDALNIVYNKLKEIFDIQNVFVMYSFFHRRLVNGKYKQDLRCDNHENFKYFLRHRIPNVFECALPSQSYSTEEKQFLSELKIYFLINSFSDNQTIDRKYIDKDRYNTLRGTDWPDFDQFIQGAEPHPDMLTKEFSQFISDRIYTNRDGVHLNQEANKIYADYFYNQWKQRNES